MLGEVCYEVEDARVCLKADGRSRGERLMKDVGNREDNQRVMATRTCKGMGSGVQVEGLVWAWRRGHFSRMRRRNKERTSADVDVGLLWDVKGDFILSFYFFWKVGGKVFY